MPDPTSPKAQLADAGIAGSSKTTSERQPEFERAARDIRDSISGYFFTNEAKLLKAIQGKTLEDMAQIGKAYQREFHSDMVQDLRRELRSIVEPPISETMLKVGQALYGHEAATFAALSAGYPIRVEGEVRGRWSPEEKKRATATVVSMMDELAKKDPSLKDKVAAAYIEFFADPALVNLRVAAEVEKLLLPKAASK